MKKNVADKTVSPRHFCNKDYAKQQLFTKVIEEGGLRVLIPPDIKCHMQ
jgi:hypothetical protein